MIVRVRLFAVARQLAGRDTVEVELSDDRSVAALRKSLASTHTELAFILPHVMFSIDAVYATDATQINAGAEVACIPPVSGG